jgi:hypothetical protein
MPFLTIDSDKRQGKESTSFCEQKEAKKLYLFLSRVVEPPREAAQKKFFGSFFQKRTS